jgi:lactoylglutathione lyase
LTGEEITMGAQFRMAHTMLRVADLNRAVGFYTGPLGMTLLRKFDNAHAKFTAAFVGYGDEKTNPAIELMRFWDQSGPYEVGTGYGHVALEVGDVHALATALAVQGVKIKRPPFAVMEGRMVIAFIEDPDGYEVELIEHRA